MLEPRVFIILVNYNNAHDTFECVESIQENNYSNYEVVIVDNKSTDHSAVQLRMNQARYHYILLEAEANDGFSSGNNIGIRYAMEQEADYVLLLNNDTLVEPDFLTELIGYQENHEECAVAIGKIYYAFDRNRIWYAGGSVSSITTRTAHYDFGKKDNHRVKEPIQVSFATGCYVSIRKGVFEEVGLLDEDYFLYDEDTDYSLRLLKKGKKIFYVPSSIIYHKVSASTGGGSDLTQYYQVRNHFLLIKKNLKWPNSLVAIGYTALYLVKRTMKGELKPKNVWMGTVRYLQGETKKKR